MNTIQTNVLLTTINHSLDTIESEDAGTSINTIPQKVSDGFRKFVFSVQPIWRHKELSFDQENLLINATKDGNARAARTLLDICQPLLESYCTILRTTNPKLCPHILMAAGEMGIANALHTFTPNPRTPFTIYCRYAVARHMLMASKDVHVGITGVQRTNQRTHICPIEAITNTATATSAPRQDSSLITLLNDVFVQAYAQATPRQRAYLDILKQPEGREMSVETIGQQMNIRTQSARQLRHRCFRLLRTALAQRGIQAPHDAV